MEVWQAQVGGDTAGSISAVIRNLATKKAMTTLSTGLIGVVAPWLPAWLGVLAFQGAAEGVDCLGREAWMLTDGGGVRVL